MNLRWREIAKIAENDEAIAQGCLAVLREHIDELARARVGQPNAYIRFIADMTVLYYDTLGGFSGRGIGPSVANRVLGDLVRDWLNRRAP